MIEIDGVKRALEHPVTEAGDYISDEYFIAIDLATSPNLWQKDVNRLASAVRRLNRNKDATCVYLGWAGLVDTYNDVIGQLNDINSWSDEIGELQPLVPNGTQELTYSASFKFG